MTYQEIEKELINVEQSKRYLNNLAKAIDFYREKLTSPKSTKYSKSKIQSSNENIRDAQLAEFADLSLDYDKLLVQVMQKEKRIYRAINFLDMEEQNILIEKYIHGLTWQQIVEKCPDNMRYSESTLKRRRKSGIKNLLLLGDFLEIIKS